MSWVTAYGVAALTFMMVMYWLEHRGPLSSCASRSDVSCKASMGSWPVRGRSVLEAVWCLIAVRRYAASRLGRGEAAA